MGNKTYVEKIRSDAGSLWKRDGPQLGHLDMELTERCNNNCIHCYINLPSNDMEAKRRELPTEKIKEIMAEAASLGCISVRFTGGEPLLREDFEEIYIFTRKLGIKVLLFTNAILINKRIGDLLAEIPPMEKIEVTLYGMKRRSYEGVSRNPGSFDDAMGGINLLLKNRVPFIAKGAILPANRGEVEDFYKWAGEIEWMDKPMSFSMFYDLRCHHDSEEKNRLIKTLRLSPEEGFEILKNRTENYVKELKDFCSKFLSPPSDRLFSCGTGISGGCVSAYGSFQPCLMLKSEKTAYNLIQGSMKDALINFFPKIREMRSVSREYLDRCGKCFLRGLCEQCPAKSWTEHGTLDTPVDYLCDIAHYQARQLGLLKENERSWTIKDWQKRIKNMSKEPI